MASDTTRHSASAALTQNLLKGFSLMLLAVFFIQIMNASAKVASDALDPIEIVFYRGLFGLACLMGWIVSARRFDLLKTDRPIFHLNRALVGNLSVCTVFWAYSLMPMTECTALILTSGLITTVLSLLFLRETIGLMRWMIVVIGFIGTLLVVQPAGDNFNFAGVGVALLAAFTTACVAVMLRSLGKTEHMITSVFYFMAIGVGISGTYMMFNGSLPPQALILPLLGAGVAGLLQQLLKTEAYRYADASFLSPCLYTQLIWATLFGWVFWDEIPTLPVIAGAGLIAASNLALAWHQGRKKRPAQDGASV